MIDWLMDSGNSRLKLARREPSGWQIMATLDFDDPALTDRFRALMQEFPFQRAFLASVSQGWRAERLDALLGQIRQPVTRIESMARIGRLRTAYQQPKQLGVDRFLALLAASDLDQNTLLLSFGTALTADVLTADGRHRGGLIAPSPDFQWQRMRDHFPGLFENPGRAQTLADNTADALATGIEQQLLGMVQRLLSQSFADESATILVSGGGAEPWLRLLPKPCEFAPDLLFQGMLRYIELSGL
jgi:type III pantothenate kinase